MLEKEPEIVITIDPAAAEVEIEVRGVTGTGCKALSQPYEALFGTKEDRLKPEYHATAKQANRQQAGS